MSGKSKCIVSNDTSSHELKGTSVAVWDTAASCGARKWELGEIGVVFARE